MFNFQFDHYLLNLDVKLAWMIHVIINVPKTYAVYTLDEGNCLVTALEWAFHSQFDNYLLT